jgi:hypothetical protein
MTDDFWVNKWNKKHCDCIKLGSDKRNEVMANFAEVLIIKAKDKYYSGNPIMSDQAYDRFEKWLKILRLKSFVLIKVGS